LRVYCEDVFTTKDTKHVLSKVEGSTKFGVLIIPTLRDLRGEQKDSFWPSTTNKEEKP
jgi:hypothetical protein